MILLTCAVEKELSFWRPRQDVELLVTGVGPVEAACAIAAALAGGTFSYVVNAGLGGAFDGAAPTGDGVVVTEDAMELTLESGEPIALPHGQRVLDTSESDRTLVAALSERGFATLRGITVARVTSTEETATRLLRDGAQVESMEGFAALRAAHRAGVRAIEVRGIANRVGARERSGWSFEAGARGLARVLAACFDAIDAERASAAP